MTKWYVNAPGAGSVEYDSKRDAELAAKAVAGADVSKDAPKPKGRHRHADNSSTATATGGVGSGVSSYREGPLRRLFRR